MLRASGKVWALENVGAASRELGGVEGESLIGMCGSMVGRPIYLHRCYQLSFAHKHTLKCDHHDCCLGASTLLPRQKRTKQADGSVIITPLPPCCPGNVWGCHGSPT